MKSKEHTSILSAAEQILSILHPEVGGALFYGEHLFNELRCRTRHVHVCLLDKAQRLQQES